MYDWRLTMMQPRYGLANITKNCKYLFFCESSVQSEILSKVSYLNVWRYKQRKYYPFFFFRMLCFYYLSFIIWRTVVRWYGINKRTSWTPPSKRLTLESIYPIKLAWPFKFDCKWKKGRLFISNNFHHMVIRLSNYNINFESDLPR